MSNPYKILIADDSQVIQLSIHEMLINDLHNNYIVYKANDGREACTMAYKFKPDLLLIDIEMPVMDGIEAIKKIKSNDQINNIPIIVMSSTRNFIKAFTAGADDFLLKPINQYELLLRIHLNIKVAKIASEVQLQNQLLEQQKEEVTIQRDRIFQHQKDLEDDMNYARTIQNAIFPQASSFQEFCDSLFIYNRPKNIVSGDFYFVAQKNDCYIFALGDCTGHGISGALMTIAGTAFLNDIINNHDILTADLILNELRIQVIKLLHQKGEIGEASNGMDISLCIFNKETNTIQYAGANNPMYIKRLHNNELEIIKADRMPIGFHINYKIPFSKQEIDINKGDIIYMFSDGYADQFGGPFGKKFRYLQFQKLLLSNSKYSLQHQLQTIDKTMTDWMHLNEQVDDILVIGIKF